MHLNPALAAHYRVAASVGSVDRQPAIADRQRIRCSTVGWTLVAGCPPHRQHLLGDGTPVMLWDGWLALAPPNVASPCRKPYFARLSSVLFSNMAISDFFV